MPELSKASSLEAAPAKLDKAELVDVIGTGGDPVQARLISNPAGTNDYYADTRDANDKLVIGRKLDME